MTTSTQESPVPSTATNSFIYNGEDLRVSKTDSSGTSAVITDGTSPASAVLKDARAVYTPGISERASSTSKFYHGDALGSTRGITNGSQTVTDAVLYDAFGMTVSRTGTTATPFGFVGAQQYQSDADSGLQLLGHRMYDPSVGRFISSDPAQAGTNWYCYCDNTPLSRTDPLGLDWLNNAANFFGGAGDSLTSLPLTGPINDIGAGLGQKWHLPTSWTEVGRLVSGSDGQVDQGSGWYIGGGVAGDIIGGGLVGGPKRGPCFVAGTPVQMVNGKSEPIEKVKPGDRVISRDPKTGKTQNKRVVRTFMHPNAKTLVLRFSSGEQITTTQDHRFFVKGKGFVQAGNLAVGSAIVARIGPAIRVVEIDRHSPTATVYNFEVADYHTYFVGLNGGGILVHNDCTKLAREFRQRFGGGSIVRIFPVGPGAGPKALMPPKGGWKLGGRYQYHDVFIKKGMVYDPYSTGNYDPIPFSKWSELWDEGATGIRRKE